MDDINRLKILRLFYAKNKDTILRSPSCDTVSPLSVYFIEKNTRILTGDRPMHANP